ncbi:MAG: methyltransferase [Acholeplasma sp.]|nr:methyltransferase [Acholeplasma sp.]
MSHYYITDKSLEDDYKELEYMYRGLSLKFITNSGVFSRDRVDFGTRLLLETLILNDQDKEIIDMGTGYGVIGISLAKLYPNKYFNLYDINERACELALKNQKLNKVNNVNVNVSNLFENVKVKADVVITNPPIRTGKDTIFKLYEDAYKSLNDEGRLYCVIQKKQGAPSTLEKLKLLFNKVEILNKSKGYWIILAKK